ncbi:hypothetical protein BDR06DRAFT_1039392, partial [Suillus hirtellus]
VSVSFSVFQSLTTLNAPKTICLLLRSLTLLTLYLIENYLPVDTLDPSLTTICLFYLVRSNRPPYHSYQSQASLGSSVSSRIFRSLSLLRGTIPMRLLILVYNRTTSLAHGALLKLCAPFFVLCLRVLKRPHGMLWKHIALYPYTTLSGLELLYSYPMVRFASTHVYPSVWDRLQAFTDTLLMLDSIFCVQKASGPLPSGSMTTCSFASDESILLAITILDCLFNSHMPSPTLIVRRIRWTFPGNPAKTRPSLSSSYTLDYSGTLRCSPLSFWGRRRKSIRRQSPPGVLRKHTFYSTCSNYMASCYMHALLFPQVAPTSPLWRPCLASVVLILSCHTTQSNISKTISTGGPPYSLAPSSGGPSNSHHPLSTCTRSWTQVHPSALQLLSMGIGGPGVFDPDGKLWTDNAILGGQNVLGSSSLSSPSSILLPTPPIVTSVSTATIKESLKVGRTGGATIEKPMPFFEEFTQNLTPLTTCTPFIPTTSPAVITPPMDHRGESSHL